MTLTPLHNKTKFYQNRDGFSVTFSAIDKSTSSANFHSIYKHHFIHNIYIILKNFAYDNVFAKLHHSSSAGFPVIIISPERHIVEVCTFFFLKIMGPWMAWLKIIEMKKRLIYSEYQR